MIEQPEPRLSAGDREAGYPGLHFGAVVLLLLCAGCGGGREPQERPVEGDLVKADVLRFLRAHPVLLPLSAQAHDAARSSALSGQEIVEMNRRLDAEAREYGYSSFRDYEEQTTRITNAAAFIEMTDGHEGEMDPPASVREGDLEAVRPYLDDVKRVSDEASRRIDEDGRPQAGEGIGRDGHRLRKVPSLAFFGGWESSRYAGR